MKKQTQQRKAQPAKAKKVISKSARKPSETKTHKKDFSRHYKRHRVILQRAGCDIDKATKLRHSIHREAEGGFEEFKTKAKILAWLKRIGVDNKKDVTECAGTGLVVDLKGKLNNKSLKGACKKVAFRADMDALPIPENNPGLSYKTKTSFAHMCGHDGHMACLLLAAEAIQKHLHRIPKEQTVRLLFQPAEEGPGGAKPMIEEGCLEGVDEVYGFHNIPNFDEGDIRVCAGPFFAESITIRIRITGQGGHASTPHKLCDPITCATQVMNQLHTIKSRDVDSKENFVFSICHFRAGHTSNVYPDEAIMEGTMRTYSAATSKLISKRINQICHSVAKAMECKAHVEIVDKYPAVINHETETQHVIRLAKQWFGPDHFSQEDIPLAAGEDFSYFLQKKPGCFFALGTLKPGKQPKTLHTSDYNFNDDMLATGAYFWLRLLEDRLDVDLKLAE